MPVITTPTHFDPHHAIRVVKAIAVGVVAVFWLFLCVYAFSVEQAHERRVQQTVIDAPARHR